MARQRSRRRSEARKTSENAIPGQRKNENEPGWVTRNDDDSEDEVMADDASDGEIDDDEAELEALVLGKGDDAFMEELQRAGDGQISEEEEDDQRLESEEGLPEGEHEELGLEGLDDADLFYLDTAPAAVAGEILPIQQSITDEGLAQQGEPFAWDDSDDDRLVVSLAGNTRLRKLRTYDGEDVVSGKEYISRLRRQFERLHPLPAWAAAASSERPAKRRRRDSDSSFYSSDEDEGAMHIDEDDLSTLPLARLLQSTQSLTTTISSSKTKFKLRPETINIQRSRDLSGGPQPSAITSLSFHPTLPLLLTSGLASTLYLHHISPSAVPTPNPLVTSIHIKHTPIHTSAFLPSLSDTTNSPVSGADKIFFSGRRRYFHTWTLSSGAIQKTSHPTSTPSSLKSDQRSFERFKLSPCGRYMGVVGTSKKGGAGAINILSAETTHWISAARIEGGYNGGVADFAWWGDGSGLTVVGRNGEVGEYSVEEGRMVAVWHDEGAVGITTLALGGKIARDELDRRYRAWGEDFGPDRWVAVGSTAGVVNLYDRRSWLDPSSSSSSSSTTSSHPNISSTSNPIPIRLTPHPKPFKTLTNLTTPISFLAFNPDYPPSASGPNATGTGVGGQILLLASRHKKDALRLVHLPSGTVYRNWPTGQTPLGRVSAVGWGWVNLGLGSSGGNGEEGVKKEELTLVLGVGNEAGRGRLWEIRA